MCEICDRKIYLVRDIVRYMWVGVSVRDTYDCELTSNVHRTERMSLSVACWGIRYTHFITLSLSLKSSRTLTKWERERERKMESKRAREIKGGRATSTLTASVVRNEELTTSV